MVNFPWMRPMHSLAKKHLNKISIVIFLLLLIIVLILVVIRVYESNVHELSRDKSISSQTVLRVAVAGSPHENDHLPFDWSRYMNPANPEFWADGDDGIIPRPFLKLASEPTKENAKKLLLWKQLQWEAVRNVIEALGSAHEIELYSEIIGTDFLDFLAKKDPLYALASANSSEKNTSKEGRGQIEWNELKVVYIYRSTCSHCKNSVKFIDALDSLGANLRAFQIDYANNEPLHPNSIPYTEDVKEVFPLSPRLETPAFYFKYKNETPFSHIGGLHLSQLTNHIKNNKGERNETF